MIMKKVLKAFFILILVLLLAAGGLLFYLYKMVNNYTVYEDKYVDYQTELVPYEDSKFEDFIFYDKENNLFIYEVPAVYLYKIINIESMEEFLNLPEEVRITELGVEPDLASKKIYIYMGITYKNYIHCAMKLDTHYALSEDQKRVELYCDDYYLINDTVMKYADKYISIPKGKRMFTHEFPTFVAYYQMPDYKPEYIYDLNYDGQNITATYDIKAALQKYKEENYDQNSLSQKLDAIWLEIRKAGIRHN